MSDSVPSPAAERPSCSAGEVTRGETAGGASLPARLANAPIELFGQFADASNATLLVRLRDRDERTLADLAESLGMGVDQLDIGDLDPSDLAVYKPQRGEQPLADFAQGTLHLREVAAALVCDALGWQLVPPTVIRQDGPFGVGSLQQFVAHDLEQDYFTLLAGDDKTVIDGLKMMVVFDLLVNNADRKAGHVLALSTTSLCDLWPVRLIDHGLTFAVEDKLRTVAWDFAGEPLPAQAQIDLARVGKDLGGDLGERLAGLLSIEEIEALRHRAQVLIDSPQFPAPPTHRRPFPWPLY